MTNKTRFTRIRILAGLLCAGLSQSLSAQPYFPLPTRSEQSAIATPYQLASINTSMIECPFGGTLAAIVQSDYNGIYLHVDYGNGATINSPILVESTPWGLADVTIGDDMNAPGDRYIIAISYRKQISASPLTYEIHLKRYVVDDVSGALNVNPDMDLNLGQGTDPKIDNIADENTIIGNYPAMNRLMMLYTNGANNMRILTAEMDFSGISIANGPAEYKGTDIAAVKDLGSGQVLACVSALSNNNTTLWAIEHNLSTNANTITMLDNGISSYDPRIEAFGIYDPTAGFAKWAVTASDHVRNINLYTNLTTAYTCNPWAQFNKSTQEAPVLASGIGPVYGNTSYTGNRQYSYAWAAPANNVYFAQAIDASGLPVDPDSFRVVNNSPCTMFVDPREVIAMANSANSGYGTIVAWNEGSEVRYKQLDNVYRYKPTGIGELKSLISLTVSPNPARDRVKIRTSEDVSTLSIVNSLGALVSRQAIRTGETTVDISQLAAGTYFLHISGKAGTTTRPLVVVP